MFRHGALLRWLHHPLHDALKNCAATYVQRPRKVLENFFKECRSTVWEIWCFNLFLDEWRMPQRWFTEETNSRHPEQDSTCSEIFWIDRTPHEDTFQMFTRNKRHSPAYSAPEPSMPPYPAPRLFKVCLSIVVSCKRDTRNVTIEDAILIKIKRSPTHRSPRELHEHGKFPHPRGETIQHATTGVVICGALRTLYYRCIRLITL